MYVYVAIVLLSAALSGFGVFKVQDWRYGAKEAERLEQAREDRVLREKTIDTAAVGHETDKVRIQTEYLVITERVNDVVQTDFYAAGAPACLDDAGVRAYNAAVGAVPAASQPAPAVPGLKPAHWWQPGRSAAKTD